MILSSQYSIDIIGSIMYSRSLELTHHVYWNHDPHLPELREADG